MQGIVSAKITQEQKMHNHTSYGLRRDMMFTSVTGSCPPINHHMTNPEFSFLLRVTFRDIQLLDMHSNNHKTIVQSVQSLRIGLPCCQYCLYRCFT